MAALRSASTCSCFKVASVLMAVNSDKHSRTGLALLCAISWSTTTTGLGRKKKIKVQEIRASKQSDELVDDFDGEGLDVCNWTKITNTAIERVCINTSCKDRQSNIIQLQRSSKSIAEPGVS